ncbi:hypothetical protein L345_13589, partial [Ophiophagus hannah]
MGKPDMELEKGKMIPKSIADEDTLRNPGKHRKKIRLKPACLPQALLSLSSMSAEWIPKCSNNGLPQFKANSLITIGLAGAQQQIICNESFMLQNLPVCGKSFEEMMHKVDSTKWCNLTEFI